MRFLWLLLIVLSGVTSAGCEVIGDIFQAGLYVGVFLVVLVVGIVGFLVMKLRS